MGRNRVPSNVLELRGAFDKNPQRRREEPKVDTGLGAPPDYLTTEELAAWAEIEASAPEGILSRADRITVEMMVRTLIKFRNREPVKTAEMNLLLSMLSRFGMTPADRSRVAAPKEAAQGDFWGVFDASA